MIPSPRTPEVIARVRQAIVALQLTRIAIAHSMLDYADLSQDRLAIGRCRREARAAYVGVVRMLPKLHSTPDQAAQLKERLAALKARLKAAQVESLN